MKFPTIKHLPGSPGVEKNDSIMVREDMNHLFTHEVVVTEKLDGENTSMHHDRIHARSENSNSRTYQNYVKALHASIQHKIPEFLQIFGENVYAQHSIHYDKLDDFFYVFLMFDKLTQRFFSYDATTQMCQELGLKYVPLMFKGNLSQHTYQPESPSAFGPQREGFVVRVSEGFPLHAFSRSIAKWVRADHVQTDEHWTRNWIPNVRTQ